MVLGALHKCTRGWILCLHYRHEQREHQTMHWLVQGIEWRLMGGHSLLPLTYSLDEILPETKCTFLY